MKALRPFVCLMLCVGLLFGNPLFVLAQQEHGGQEHAGEGEVVKEHGGEMTAEVGGEATLLKESADALEVTRPDLAARLRAWAEKLAAGEEGKEIEEWEEK